MVLVFGRSGDVVGDGGAGDERHAHRPRLGDEPGDLRRPQSRPWVRTIKEFLFFDFSSAVFSDCSTVLLHIFLGSSKFHWKRVPYLSVNGISLIIKLFGWDDLEFLGP